MTGSMYAGIAGLKTHMQNLNVIGNNIANVNTYGYKAGRSVFRSALYTSIGTGREGTSVVGSKNPSQIGYGSNLATVDIDVSTKNFALGKSTDCMIDGDGFFMVGDKEMADIVDPKDPSTFKSFSLTRVGDFEFGSDGYLKDGVGNVVYGFLCMGTVNGEPVYCDQLVPIRVPRMDENGNVVWPHLETEEGEGEGEEGGKLKLVDTLRPTTEDGDDQTVVNEYTQAKLNNITISNTGLIKGTIGETGLEITVGSIALATVDNPNGVSQLSNSYFKCSEGAGNLYVNMMGGSSKSVYVTNGNLPTGDEEGEEEAIVLPTEDNPEVTFTGGVLRLGMTYVNASQATGGDDAGGDEATSLPYGSRVFDTGKASLLVVGGLEMSGTDLATEIASMITTQRGYQANTRIVTVTDSMLEELVNMKR